MELPSDGEGIHFEVLGCISTLYAMDHLLANPCAAITHSLLVFSGTISSIPFRRRQIAQRRMRKAGTRALLGETFAGAPKPPLDGAVAPFLAEPPNPALACDEGNGGR